VNVVKGAGRKIKGSRITEKWSYKSVTGPPFGYWKSQGRLGGKIAKNKGRTD